MIIEKGKGRQNVLKLQPPGPPGWPVFSTIFDLGTVPHQTLYKLRSKYGLVLGLKLGSVNTVVIQSAKAASKLFNNHDQDFCDRKCPVALTAHNYGQGAISLGRYGNYWRLARRICSTEFLVNRRINEMAPLRRKCIDDMMRYMEEDVAAAHARGEEGKVNLAHYLFLISFNLIGNLVLSRDILSSRSEEGKEFFDAMNKGIKWNMVRDMGRAMKIVSKFVEQKIKDRKLAKEKTTKDLLDVFLEYEGISLAHKVIRLGLATLLHSFDWQLGNNITPEAIDMEERMGIRVRKLIPLEAIPKKRILYGR
ncbi:hypothetical protein PTKIN_Ptkin13bG0254600 [Pterospermum kingtungense]